MGGKRTHAKTPRPARHVRTQEVPVALLLATGAKAQRTGDPAAAERAFRRVLAVAPHNDVAVQFLGAILVERGNLDEAIDLFEAAADHIGAPTIDTVGFYNNYANALRIAQRYPSSEKVLRELVALAPRDWQPWHNLAQTLKDCERYDEAAAAIRRAVVLEPSHGPNHGVLGEILHKLGRLHSSEAALNKCIELGWSSDTGLWTWLGNNQRLLGRLDDALASLEHALKLSGGTTTAHCNLGIVLLQVGRLDEALAHLERALELDPDDDKLHAYHAYAFLTAGRLDGAWEEWERGLCIGGPRGSERPVEVPRWTAEDRDARVLVYREQGVGDEIMFASCYPDLIDAARDVVIECDTRLIPLFTRSFPQAEVRAQTIDERFRQTKPDFDRALPAGSLPMHFRRKVEDFPDRHSYLVADEERVSAWRVRLADAGPGPYVGISWRSKIRTSERRLEYSRIDEWGEVFAVPGVTWVNLQYDDCERDLRDAEQQFRVRVHRWDWVDLMNDFDEVAALSRALDLVIAPRNAVAMLASALGVPTIALGNAFAWNDLGTDNCPWVPALRAENRLPTEEWDDVLRNSARAVADLAGVPLPSTSTARSA